MKTTPERLSAQGRSLVCPHFLVYSVLINFRSLAFPSTLYETYAYDAANNLTSKIDRNNHAITYTYDQLNRLTQKTYPDSYRRQRFMDLSDGRVPAAYLAQANSMFLLFFAFNGVNNLRVFNIAFSSIPTAPTKNDQ